MIELLHTTRITCAWRIMTTMNVFSTGPITLLLSESERMEISKLTKTCRRIRDPRQHYLQAARDCLVPW